MGKFLIKIGNKLVAFNLNTRKGLMELVII